MQRWKQKERERGGLLESVPRLGLMSPRLDPCDVILCVTTQSARKQCWQRHVHANYAKGKDRVPFAQQNRCVTRNDDRSAVAACSCRYACAAPEGGVVKHALT